MTNTTLTPQANPAPFAIDAAAAGFRNREDWLNRAAVLLLSFIGESGAYATTVRPYISVGFPRGARHNTVGQAWTGARSADGQGHIFISPTVDDAFEAIHVLLHELGHDIVGVEHGHRKPFGDFCDTVGLAKPYSATTPEPRLESRLRAMMDLLGPYPHAALDASRKPKPKRERRDHVYMCEGCQRKLTVYGNEPLVAVHYNADGTVCGGFVEQPREAE